MTTLLQKDLVVLIGRQQVQTDSADLFSYSSDATNYFAKHEPDAIVLPQKTEDVAKVVKYAAAKRIPIVPRGAGSGLSGGATPIRGGIVIDMKRMNSIIEINRGNMTAIVESGVVLKDFYNAVEKLGLFYPPDPQSNEVCTIGGNVSTRAGGPRCLKYGTTSHYVLGLEVVMPNGSVINTGGTTVKHSVGYDLTHLLTGAEGTLGVITKIIVRLIPLPEAHSTIIVSAGTPEIAAQIVSKITASPAVPAMLEYISQSVVGLLNTFIPSPLPTESKAFLFIDVDGSPSQIKENSALIKKICADLKADNVRVIEDETEAASYWQGRAKLSPLVMQEMKRVIFEDITVPRDKIPAFVKSVDEIARSTGTKIGIAGHAGDGNIHPAILMDCISEKEIEKADQAVEKLIRKGLELGGCISGEHGIGIHKSQFIEMELGTMQIEFMKKIKSAIDPLGIMNPGKIWLTEGGS